LRRFREKDGDAMKAAFIEKTGGPEVIQFGDLPRREPAGSEALVKVAAVAVNPIDTYIRAGEVPMSLEFPFIIGADLAGTVAAVGPDVTRLKTGDRVWGSNQGLLGRPGTFAEYACVEEKWLYSIPPGVDEKQAAAVALVGITAHLGLFLRADLNPGEWVYVPGGTGGVGSMVVQMARAAGARVITTVGSSEKATFCKQWGAEGVLNYKTDDVGEGIRQLTAGRGVNVWYDTQSEPDLVKIADLMAMRGRIVLVAGRTARPPFPLGPFRTKDLAIHGFAMFNATALEQALCAEDINRWLFEKKLQAPIGKVMPLSQSAQAHRLQEESTVKKSGTLLGKIVLIP
jgi:NADPH2:quinone reductase